jgi:hypothetical protein
MDIFFYFYVFFLLQHEQKLHNLQGAEISDGDSKTGPRSALKALGKNNPASLLCTRPTCLAGFLYADLALCYTTITHSPTHLFNVNFCSHCFSKVFKEFYNIRFCALMTKTSYFFLSRPDPTNFHEGMRILTERKASSDEIEAYVKTVQTYEVNHSLSQFYWWRIYIVSSENH